MENASPLQFLQPYLSISWWPLRSQALSSKLWTRCNGAIPFECSSSHCLVSVGLGFRCSTDIGDWLQHIEIVPYFPHRQRLHIYESLLFVAFDEVTIWKKRSHVAVFKAKTSKRINTSISLAISKRSSRTAKTASVLNCCGLQV